MRNEPLASLACDHIKSYIGTPYRWGGDDPSGLDCSGLVIVALQGVGLFPQGSDATADTLYRMFPPLDLTPVPLQVVVLAPGGIIYPPEHGRVRPGCLVFFGTPAKVTHVEWIVAVVDGQPYSIGASGGGSKTLSPKDAWAQNAWVKLRAVNGPGARKDIVGYCDPFASEV